MSYPTNQNFYTTVKFINGSKSYYFSTDDETLKPDDLVIVETIRGIEMGIVQETVKNVADFKSPLELKPIFRKASQEDLDRYKLNLKNAKEAQAICISEINALELPMNVISTEYTLDRGKLIFSYLADERVDFRELLRILASKFHTRIELRQIGPRDRAKSIGGIGICGLEVCCSVFLNEFDGISINRAKNQLLSLNIPKLSGLCGKLICCLKFEDDNYTELRKKYPRMGEKVNYNDLVYRISSVNVLTETIKLENPDDVQFMSLDDVLKLMKNKPYIEKKSYKTKEEE